jgi:hypothetical protein
MVLRLLKLGAALAALAFLVPASPSAASGGCSEAESYDAVMHQWIFVRSCPGCTDQFIYTGGGWQLVAGDGTCGYNLPM